MDGSGWLAGMRWMNEWEEYVITLFPPFIVLNGWDEWINQWDGVM